MGFSWIPKEVKFFDMFDEQSKKLIEAADCFIRLTHDDMFNEAGAKEMGTIEGECDNVTHDIINKLNRTFITPFDREDIHALAHEMDNIVDLLCTITDRMFLYRLNSTPDLNKFAEVIKESVEMLAKTVESLRDLKQPDLILQHCIEINRLENVGDKLRDATIGKLFDDAHDPISVIKWKEIYEDAETVLDQCEDVANIVETIIVKQG